MSVLAAPGHAVMTALPGAARRRAEMRIAWLFVLPLLTGLMLFLVGPSLAVLAMAFTDWHLGAGRIGFAGFDNFVELAGDRVFHISATNTIVYALMVTPTSGRDRRLARGGRRELRDRACIFPIRLLPACDLDDGRDGHRLGILAASRNRPDQRRARSPRFASAELPQRCCHGVADPRGHRRVGECRLQHGAGNGGAEDDSARPLRRGLHRRSGSCVRAVLDCDAAAARTDPRVRRGHLVPALVSCLRDRCGDHRRRSASGIGGDPLHHLPGGLRILPRWLRLGVDRRVPCSCCSR